MSQPLPTPIEVDVYCLECGYNLTGTPGKRCPWCGWKIDAGALAAASEELPGARRVGVVVACAVLGVGSLVVVAALVTQGARLSLYDGSTVLAVLAAAGGHLFLAVLAALGTTHWPIRQRETGDILRLVGWLSVAAGILGASDALVRDWNLAPGGVPARGVQGIVVSGVMEFFLRSLFFTLPGCTLLILRMVSLRSRSSPLVLPPYQGGIEGGEGMPMTARAAAHADSRGLQPAARLDRAPFVVEVFDRYTRSQLSQRWHNTPRPTTPAIEAAIVRTWEAEQSLAAQENRVLYDGKLARLLRAEVSGNVGSMTRPTPLVRDSNVAPACLHLELGPTSYRDFVGTNVHNPSLALQALGRSALANPLGISVTVITVEGFLVFCRRAAAIRRIDRPQGGLPLACHAGFLHTLGGMLEEPDRRDDGGYDIFGAAARELHEVFRPPQELGIREEEITEMITAGLVRDRALHQPELLFEATSILTRDDLKKRFDQTQVALPSVAASAPGGAAASALRGGRTADQEHTAIEFVHDDPDAIIPFIERAAPVTPVAQAAMLLHGRYNWGPDWYEQACYVLYGEMPPVIGGIRNAEC